MLRLVGTITAVTSCIGCSEKSFIIYTLNIVSHYTRQSMGSSQHGFRESSLVVVVVVIVVIVVIAAAAAAITVAVAAAAAVVVVI